MTGDSTDFESGMEKTSQSIPLLKSLVNLRKICNHPSQADKTYLANLNQTQLKNINKFDASGKFQSIATLFQQLGFEQG